MSEPKTINISVSPEVRLVMLAASVSGRLDSDEAYQAILRLDVAGLKQLGAFVNALAQADAPATVVTVTLHGGGLEDVRLHANEAAASEHVRASWPDAVDGMPEGTETAHYKNEVFIFALRPGEGEERLGYWLA